MKERYEVDCADGAYRVLDPSGAVVATFRRRPDAFAFVRDWGGRVHLEWARTVLNNRIVSGHFSASHGPFKAGRLMPVISGDERGRWAWFVNGTDPDTGRGGGASGRADTKDEAVADLEAAYAEFIANADRYAPRGEK